MEIEGRTREEAYPGRCFVAWRKLEDERRLVLTYEAVTARSNMARDAGPIHDAFHLLSDDVDVGAWVAELDREPRDPFEPSGFTALFVAIVDPVRMELSYLNAGSVPPFVRRAEDGVVERLPLSRPALGLIEGLPPERVSRVALAPRDVILCTSSDIVEATNATQEDFGEARVLEVLAEADRTPLFLLLAHLFERLDEFRGRRDDQAVALAMRF